MLILNRNTHANALFTCFMVTVELNPHNV